MYIDTFREDGSRMSLGVGLAPMTKQIKGRNLGFAPRVVPLTTTTTPGLDLLGRKDQKRWTRNLCDSCPHDNDLFSISLCFSFFLVFFFFYFDSDWCVSFFLRLSVHIDDARG